VNEIGIMFGAMGSVVLILLGWNIWLEIRIRSMQASVYEVQLQKSFADIQARNKRLSNAELDDLLAKDLSGDKT